MADHDGVPIFRVIVRGRFDDLRPAQREALRAGLEAASDLDAYAFSRAGTLAYDRRLDFFSVRIEVRVEEDVPGDALDIARSRGEAIATDQLAQRGFGWKDLRVTATDMADVWR